jgi:hypothetical protein
MSKIYKVRKAFHKIFPLLKNHEVSCIFFNNDVKILSTLDGYEYNVDHSLLYQSVQNIKCSSITNFAKIIEGLKEIDSVNSNLKQVSVVISDGHHTVDDETNISLDTIESILEKRFDHAIGLGNEFDRNLMQKIGKTFHETQTDNMFNFLQQDLYQDHRNYIILPPDTFFVSCSEFKKIEDYNSLENNTEDIECVERGRCQDSFILKERQPRQEGEKKHYVFVIDISGSMDDCFLSRVVESYYQDANFFYHKTKGKRTCIQFFDDRPLISIKKLENSMYVENINDSIIKTCFIFYEMENDVEKDIIKLYSLYNKVFDNFQFQRFVKKKYKNLLSNGQQYLLNLIHEEITPINNWNTETTLYEKDLELCPICVSNNRNVVLSCSHMISCINCIEKLLDGMKHECPICRTPITWLRLCKFPNDTFKCIECETNTINVLNIHSGKAEYCTLCFEKNHEKADSSISIKII